MHPTPLPLSTWSQNVSPSPTLAIDAKTKALQAAGEDVCNFAAGEPDFDTPEHIKEAAIVALRAGKTKYAPTPGIPELRKAIVDRYAAEYGFSAAPEQVIVSPGGKFNCYLGVLAVYSRGELEALVAVAVKHNLYILSDEMYEHLVYDNARPTCVATLSEAARARTILVAGFSKTYAMTGWRIGTTVAPLPIAKAISELQSQMSSNVTTFAQYGALAALREKEKTAAALKVMMTAFDRRRKLLHAELNRIAGISCLLAEGAFYLFPNISSFGLKDADFCARLLEAEKVGVIPGSAFGAEGYLRLSYATSDEVIQKGVTRIARFCASLKQ